MRDKRSVRNLMMSSRKPCRQNIRVAVRCRPLNSREYSLGEFNVVEQCKDQKITLKDKSSSSRSYTFDRVFGPQSKQKDIYSDMVAPTVVEVLEGYNCTIFAYGQTGTGKTFTMTGERSDSLRYTWETDPTAGIVPRALNQIFSTLEMMGCDFSVRVSFLELYNEELFDLLSSGEETVRLTVYDDANKKGSVFVKGLREVAVHNKEEVYNILEKGLLRRQTASTQLNAHSSRSHTVFTVTVHIKEICPDDDEVFLKIGKLNLVDLAGSENIGRSGALDKRAREAGSINQSLLTLGRVITCLVDHSAHIPYRESKLTRLLQDSLGGKTKTSIIATIGPGSSSLEETISTLDYAHRAKNIQNRPEINQKLNKNQLIKGYNEELERLRRDLEAARSKNGIFVDAENYQTMTLQLKQQRGRIDDLESRKEILESELESAIRNFELSQQELNEIKEAKERVESELCRALQELSSATHRLEKTERRLQEEAFLRAEHQGTEEKLAEQAKDILSAAVTYEADLDGFQQKISRFESLESKNRSAIKMLPDVWLTENLKDPLNSLTSLKSDLSTRVEAFAGELARFGELLKLSCKDNLQELEKLSCFLCTIVSTNLKQAHGEVEQLVDDHVRVVTDAQKSSLEPAFDATKKLVADLQGKLDAIHLRLQQEAKVRGEIFDCLLKKAAALSHSASKWARLREIELEENQKMRETLIGRRNVEKSETRSLVEALQEALSRVSILTEARMESDMKIDESLAAKCDRIKQFADGEEKLLIQTSTQLISSITSANDTQTEAVASITSDLDSCTAHLGSLTSQVQDAEASLNTLVEYASEAAKNCKTSDDGVCKKLLDRFSQWESIGRTTDPEIDTSSIDFFKDTVDCSKKLFERNEAVMAESVSNLDSTLIDLRGRIPDFDNVSAALAPRLPVLLSEHLTKTVHGYEPTGTTPLRRTLPYPKNLARTQRHSLLLNEFRQAHGFPAQESPLVDVTNTEPRSASSCFISNPDSSECDGENDCTRKSESRASSGVGTISIKSGHFQASEDDLLSCISGGAQKQLQLDNTETKASSIKKNLIL